jgi:hypothetical protein
MRQQFQLDRAAKRSNRRRGRGTALGAGLLAACAAMLLWAAPGALAGETIYWANFSGGTISSANIDGSGGGRLNTAGQEVVEPEGMAIDSLAGRLYWTNFTGGPGGTGAIRYASLDGSGGGELNAGGAEVQEPNGVAIDPATRMIYWANNHGGASGEGSISYASLDGGGGGQLSTGAATLERPIRIAIDPAGSRIYWANDEAGSSSISWARLDGSGGGDLDLGGATPPAGITGLAVDSAAGRIYWVDLSLENVSYAGLGGGGGGDLALGGASFDDPFGLALDPAAGRIYWANYGHAEERAGAIGFANLGGGGGGLNIATAPVSGPQDPVILKPPGGVAAPLIARSPASRSVLACSRGTWAADLPGSFVYQAPQTYSYQWFVNGAPIAGATASGLAAWGPGYYACSVRASNASGSTTQVSAPVLLNPATLSLTVNRRKVRTRPRHAATFGLSVTNWGDFPSSAARLCVKKQRKPRKKRRTLKTPKCQPLGTIAAGATHPVKVKVRARRRARGVYRLTFLVRGDGGARPVKAKLIVRKHKRRRHRRR